MAVINKPLLRLAVAIAARLEADRYSERLIELPARSWDSCVELVRKIRRAQLRGWHLAADELRMDLRYTIPSVQSDLTAILAQLPPISLIQTIATANDIYRDLLALAAEFEAVEYDGRGRWLSVTTEPIELEGIYLGPFEIRLNWGQPLSRDTAAYRLIAKEPHPASARENVTHPHVMDEILCEGHGRQAVRQALAQGRLLDFFMLVAGILRTYNPESPFVELALWYSEACSDCGAVISDDERFVCHKCGESRCHGCEATCCGCDDSCCSGCTAECAACDDNYCRSCLHTCGGCQARVCTGCLDDKERCPNCHENNSSERDAGRPAVDGTSLQPHGLGQTAVFA
jgi:hypothetical protein